MIRLLFELVAFDVDEELTQALLECIVENDGVVTHRL
jgi:hypothetical protein